MCIRHIVSRAKFHLSRTLKLFGQIEPPLMTNQESLVATISDLINRKAESTHWDFKREHHTRNAELIHDVLCLANAKHTGDRFLIFGVDDKDFVLHPTNEDPKRKTQADLADFFSKNASKFFQSRFPEFYLKEITIDKTSIDVLVIQDAPHKPYYLVERYEEVCPHHIYTRVCDSNTSVDDAAQPHEIERMWRERFGLDAPALERAKRYLSEPEAWSPMVENGCNMNFHHTTFPEFTLKVAGAEDHIACHEEWTRREISTDNNHAGYYELRYHQTLLARIRYVSFDDHKKSMVAPNWEPRETGRFYFYKTDSIEYAVHKFYSTRDDSLTLSIRGEGEASNAARCRWGRYMKIPVVRTAELEGFLGTVDEREIVEPSTDEVEQYQLFLRNQIDFEDWRIRQGLDNPQ